jgi:uncharacterized repeat protein (TIGR01451 family)
MITRTLKGLRTAVVAVAALGWWMGANAQMTPANTTIANRASVNYSVGLIPQAVIESSPTGNVTPGAGAGADTWFLVDNKVDLNVTQTTGSVVVTPGDTDAVLAFTVVNAGNFPQGYALTLTEQAGTSAFGNVDNANFGAPPLIVRVDEGNGIYDGTESATAIDTLAPSASVTVFVVSPVVPLTLINGNFANINLRAQTAVAGTNGATILNASAGANLPTSVEVLFADAPDRNGMDDDTGQFEVQSAGIRVTKAQTVLSDGFGSPSPRAIPGATVQYLITIQNTSATTAANGVSLSDDVPTDTTLVGTNVALTGVLAAACTADVGDADFDGCGLGGLGGNTLTVNSGVIGNIAAGAIVTVAFQVTID